MDSQERSFIRLGDRILSALTLAIEQEDLETAELLLAAIERTITRKTGDGFVERRDYPPELDAALDKMRILRARNDL